MSQPGPPDMHDFDEEIPWPSFADAVTALLFVFIATTFWFMITLEEARKALQAREAEKAEEIEHLKGADVAAGVLLEQVSLCLVESNSEGIQVRPVVEDSTRTMALYIEPVASRIVEWFPSCSADVSPEAGQVIHLVRSCLAREVPLLAENYTVILTLEGHTDARATGGACRARFPSNWELSGARSGAALRRLLCDDGQCAAAEEAEARSLKVLAQDRTLLQLVAAGRAATIPATRALCDPDWPGASVEGALDTEVCSLLARSALTGRDAAELLRAAIATRFDGPLSAHPTRDELLVTWANDPRCGTRAADPVACDERFRRLRRVDMRVDLRVRTPLITAAANDRPPAGP